MVYAVSIALHLVKDKKWSYSYLLFGVVNRHFYGCFALSGNRELVAIPTSKTSSTISTINLGGYYDRS